MDIADVVQKLYNLEEVVEDADKAVFGEGVFHLLIGKVLSITKQVPQGSYRVIPWPYNSDNHLPCTQGLRELRSLYQSLLIFIPPA